jgi:hypothetical protein
VAWFQIEPSLTGSAHVGDLLVPIPEAATPGASYMVGIVRVQANLALTPVSVAAGGAATITVLDCGPSDCDDGDPCTTDARDPVSGECVYTPINCDDGDPCTLDACDPATGECVHAVLIDVGIERLGIRPTAKAGQKVRITASLGNSGCWDAQVQVVLARDSAVIDSRSVWVKRKGRKNVGFEYVVRSEDAPEVCLTVSATTPGDANGANDQASDCIEVR